MSMTLDEIYESFIWDKSYTDEEYKAKIAVGINQGRNTSIFIHLFNLLFLK